MEVQAVEKIVPLPGSPAGVCCVCDHNKVCKLWKQKIQGHCSCLWQRPRAAKAEAT